MGPSRAYSLPRPSLQEPLFQADQETVERILRQAFGPGTFPVA